MNEPLESLKAHLLVVKQSPPDKIEEDFYAFMLKAKDSLGETSYKMAQFYFEYGNFILQKLETTSDIFGEQAIPKNVHEEQQEELQNIPEDFSDDDSQPNAAPQQRQNEIEQIDQPQNPSPDDEDKDQEQAAVNEVAGQPEEEADDDKEVCSCNLLMAIQLYEDELALIKTGNSSTSIDEVLDGIRRSRTRLGDLFMLEENYVRCVEEYQKVIESESGRDGFECNRLVSELYYLIGNCLLYDNKPDCESKAISQYVKAVNVLLSYLCITLDYDITSMEAPCSEKVKVDRFHYMNMPGDNQAVREIKDILSCLLDKIEDTDGQIAVREAYQKEKKKIEQDNKQAEFKPVADPTKVVHLGSFGNRKRKPEEIELNHPFTQNQNLPNNSNSLQKGKQQKGEKKIQQK